MRNRSLRSFTVETKSGGRQRPIIPHRDTTPVVPRPMVFWPSAPKPQTPAQEPRRVLPNLIVPEPVEVEPEPTHRAENSLQKPRRGRPPKVKPVAAVAIEEPIAEPAAATPAPELTPARQPHVVRTMQQPTTLPLGERWKRRLGRWSR